MIMKILTAFRMCLHTYTCIPQPAVPWDEDLQPVSRAFLPAVGLVMGLLWWGIAALARWLLPDAMAAVLIALFPMIITGFVHVPGFMGVGEALLLRRGNVKPGYCGTICLVIAVMLQFASGMSMSRIFPLALLPVISRACMALAVFSSKDAEREAEDAVPKALIYIERYIVLGALILMIVFSRWGGLLAGCAALGAYAICDRVICKEQADGAEDFALVAAEFCGLLVMGLF